MDSIEAEIGGAMAAATATGGAFEPCVWGDFRHLHPSYLTGVGGVDEMRADQVKGEVRRMFEAMSTADTEALVDTLERLGVDNHFREENALLCFGSICTSSSV